MHTYKKQKPGFFKSVLLFLFLITIVLSSCKKNDVPSVDDSGSLLDTKIDTTWKSPDGSMINIKITTSFGPKDPFFSDYRDAYHGYLYLKVLSGTIKTINLKLTYRHFPKNYSELEKSTGYTYPVNETAFSTISIDPAIYPGGEFYHFIPDPGPIDRITISL